MFCKKCGTEYSDDAKFCPNCATPNGDSAPVQPPVTPMQPPRKKKKGLVAVVIVIAVIVVIAAIANLGGDEESDPGASQGAGTPKTEQTTEETIKVSAADLIKAYDENEVSADSRYKGKKLEVTGIIGDIGKDVLDDSYITLGSGGDFEIVSAQCYIKKDNLDAAAKLKKGDKITVVGKCNGSSLNVILKDCTIK